MTFVSEPHSFTGCLNVQSINSDRSNLWFREHTWCVCFSGVRWCSAKLLCLYWSLTGGRKLVPDCSGQNTTFQTNGSWNRHTPPELRVKCESELWGDKRIRDEKPASRADVTVNQMEEEPSGQEWVLAKHKNSAQELKLGLAGLSFPFCLINNQTLINIHKHKHAQTSYSVRLLLL